VYAGLRWGNQRQRDHLGDPDIDRRTGWMDLQEVVHVCEGIDWIELVQGRDKWWALVNAVMNLWVP